MIAEFFVRRVARSYEGTCRQLGVVITAQTLEAVEKTARTTAAHRRASATFRYDLAAEPLAERLRRWLALPPGAR